MSVSPLLVSAQWPRLHVLHLIQVHCTAHELVQFICAHPSITELFVGPHCGVDELQQLADPTWVPDFPPLAPGCLPNLRVLGCNMSQAIRILSAPTSHPRPLQSIHGVTFKNQRLRNQFLSLIPTIPCLDRLELVWSKGWQDVARIGRAAPKVRWLRMRNYAYAHANVPVIGEDKIVSRVMS